MYFRRPPEQDGVLQRNAHVRVAVGVDERVDGGVEVAQPHSEVDARYARRAAPDGDGVHDLERHPRDDEGADDDAELGRRLDLLAHDAGVRALARDDRRHLHGGDLAVGAAQHGEDVHVDGEHDEQRAEHEDEEAHVDVVAQVDDEDEVAHVGVVPAEVPAEERDQTDEAADEPVDGGHDEGDGDRHVLRVQEREADGDEALKRDGQQTKDGHLREAQDGAVNQQTPVEVPWQAEARHQDARDADEADKHV